VRSLVAHNVLQILSEAHKRWNLKCNVCIFCKLKVFTTSSRGTTEAVPFDPAELVS